jgi:hypothetical protein
MSLLSVICCQVGVSAKGRSLVQMSLTECGVIEEPHREDLGPIPLSSHEKKINANEVTKPYVQILVQAIRRLFPLRSTRQTILGKDRRFENCCSSKHLFSIG